MAADMATYAASYNIAGRSLDQIIPRLDALMMVLKTCKGKVCTHPWRTLHPDKTVNDLKDALDRGYDAFYATQPKMTFYSCPATYMFEEENQRSISPWLLEDGGALPGKNSELSRQPEFDYTLHWGLLI